MPIAFRLFYRITHNLHHGLSRTHLGCLTPTNKQAPKVLNQKLICENLRNQ